MAQYRLLADHYVGGSYLQAGTIVSDTDNGELPSNWIPTPACDPIDEDAINKFFAAGPQDCADPGRSLGPYFTGQRWTGIPIGPAKIYWVKEPVPQSAVSRPAWLGGDLRKFRLTGAGAALGTYGTRGPQ